MKRIITLFLTLTFIFTFAFSEDFIGSYKCQYEDGIEEAYPNILKLNADNTFSLTSKTNVYEFEWDGEWKYDLKRNVIELTYLIEMQLYEGEIIAITTVENDVCWVQPFLNDYDEYCLKVKENYSDPWETFLWYVKN